MTTATAAQAANETFLASFGRKDTKQPADRFTQHVSPLLSGVNSNSIWSMGSHLPSGMSWELMCCGGPIDATDAIAGGAMNCSRGFPEQRISWR